MVMVADGVMKKILLVDDNEDHLLLAKRSLEKDGKLEVFTAATGGEGLRMLKSDSFDLVVCDYQLPDINGLELLRRIQDDHIKAPFIMLTGRGDEHTAVSALHSGAYDYVVKDEAYLRILPRAARETLERYRADEEKRRLEGEILNKNKELEKMNKELMRVDMLKTQFIASVSHEFRTPLNAIRESLALFQDGVVDPSQEKGKKLFDIVFRNLERLCTLINDLLDFSKFESGKMQLEFGCHSIKEMIEETVEGLRALAESRKLKIVVEKIEARDAFCDRDRIVQVITNLVGNAIKFTPPGGTITLWAEAVLDGKVKVSVKDTGIGIDPAMHLRVFEKFEQVQRSVPGSELKGTGLGLAICRHIIEKHGGSIWLESELERGSTFMFTLHTKDSYDKAGGEAS